MIDLFIKLFGFIAHLLWPEKLKELQIKVRRINTDNFKETQDFIDVYNECFSNRDDYAPEELLEFCDDPKNERKHVPADNIILVAKYKGSLLAFLSCFYYPQKGYGIIAHYGKNPNFREEGKYVDKQILGYLRKLLVKKHNCELIVFEIDAMDKRMGKAYLFTRFARKIGYEGYQLQFEFVRPMRYLNDTEGGRLDLYVIPINYPVTALMPKEKVLDIIRFLHLYCYGDYYDVSDPSHLEYQNYLKGRVAYYEQHLPAQIRLVSGTELRTLL